MAAPLRADPYPASRTSWGAPDLQGTWTNRSLTRLERPASMSALIIPEEGLAAREAKTIHDFIHPADDALGQSESEWYDDMHFGRVDGQARSSWIVDPADGHVPYTPEGRKLLLARRAAMTGASANPEDRTGSDRCIAPAWAALGPPMMNAPYAANYVIVQTPDSVAILSEMNHEVRIIRLGDRHADAVLPRWQGDSVGHWEGASLVVDTVGFHPLEVFRSPPYLISAKAHVTERLTRVSPTQIKYEFTVDDPGMFTQPWRGEMPFLASSDRVFEYACHEGNYSMRGIMAGARKQEADAAAQGKR
jgi:hypothetical protein